MNKAQKNCSHRLASFLVAIPIVTAAPFNVLRFNLKFADEDFLNKGTWKWRIETELPVSIAGCWDIVTTEESFAIWFPEVRDLEVFGTPGVDGGERFNFHDFWLNLWTFGSPRFEQLVDRFEGDSSDVRTRSKWIARSSRPTCITFTKWREQFVCKAIDANTTLLTRRAATDPGIFSRLLVGVIKTRLTTIYEDSCPRRMLEGIAKGKLPANPNPE